MNGLPALLARPAAVLPADDATRPFATPATNTVTLALDNGVPARIALAGERGLVLAVAPTAARGLMNLDPGAVVVSLGATAPTSDPDVLRDPDAPAPRLTLLDGSVLGDTVPVVAGVTMTLAVG